VAETGKAPGHSAKAHVPRSNGHVVPREIGGGHAIREQMHKCQ
jgi:hypothetical protein